jgi:hypothetical protein
MQPSALELLRDILQEADFLAAQMAQTSLESFVRDRSEKGKRTETTARVAGVTTPRPPLAAPSPWQAPVH